MIRGHTWTEMSFFGLKKTRTKPHCLQILKVRESQALFGGAQWKAKRQQTEAAALLLQCSIRNWLHCGDRWPVGQEPRGAVGSWSFCWSSAGPGQQIRICSMGGAAASSSGGQSCLFYFMNLDSNWSDRLYLLPGLIFFLQCWQVLAQHRGFSFHCSQCKKREANKAKIYSKCRK